MKLSKRKIFAGSFYETACPNCGYETPFNTYNLIQREFINPCSDKKDYNVIDSNIKCQLCISIFKPKTHRTANFYTNPHKPYLFSPVQKTYMAKMKSFAAVVPTGYSDMRLNFKTNELRHSPRFDHLSVFLVDDVTINQRGDVLSYITGQNLTKDVIQCHLGLKDVAEVPVTLALDYHFNKKPITLGDVSHVTRF